jgi:hypothetical protein
MSSRFTQVTVVPTGTLAVCGPKLKLSIVISTGAAAGCAFAVMRDDTANNRMPITNGIAIPDTQILFLVMTVFLSDVDLG